MRLTKAQREKVLEWIAEGLLSDEIKKRAAKQKPPFTVSRQQVDYFRKTRNVSLEEIKTEGEFTALTSGLSLKENRVALLHDLAEKLRADLFDGNLLWLDQAKGLGSGENFERYDYREFNASEVAQLRGVLEDIADEVGGRTQKMEHSGPNGGPIPVNDGKDEDERYHRSISTLADAIGEALSGTGPKETGVVDTAKQTPMAGAALKSG